MIPWIDEKLRAWGRAKWRLITKEESSPQSVMGRIVTYGPSAGDSRTGLQIFREGMTGDALDASLAIHRAVQMRSLTDRQYEVLFTYYCCKEKRWTAGYKAKCLGMRRDSYYDALHRAHNNLIAHFIEFDTVG